MKKYIALLTLIVTTHSIVFAQVNMDDFKKQFKGKSIQDIKALLIEQNKQLAGLIKLSSLSIKITPGKPDPKEMSTTEKFSTSPKENIVKKFNDYLDKISFRQQIIYPNTILNVDFRASSLMYRVNDYNEYGFQTPYLTLKKVYFKDGTTLQTDQKIAMKDSDISDEIKGSKWIDSIGIEASYYVPKNLALVNVSEKNPNHTLAFGKIILTGINGNEIKLKMSEKVKDSIIKVEGINADGKSITQSGSSSSNMGSNYSTAFLQALVKTSEDAIVKIDKNEYQNVDALVEDMYRNMPKEDKEKPEKFTNASYSFRGNINAVNIFFKPEAELLHYNFTLKNKVDHLEGFVLAENKKGLFGLLSENGKWAIEPTHQRLDFYKGNYFMGDIGADGYASILWLDKENKKLVPFKYKFYRTDPFFNRYYSIENGVNGPKGLVDMKDNKILIEPVNDNIYSDGNFIVLDIKRDERKILNKDLKEILSFVKERFKIYGDFIFVDKPYTSKEKFADYITLSNTDDIFNKFGEKINKADYVIQTFDFFGMDSLLLVKNKAGKKLFINTKGDVVIDASKYKEASFFSNGLAAVKNDKDNWGYINTSGNLVIPFMYNAAKNFSKFSALVDTPEGYKLIDRNNKTIKKFTDGFSSYSVGKDAEELKYNNYNGKIYGSRGEVIKDLSN